MQTDFIKLNVPEDIAQAFRNATPETQERASKNVWSILRYTLMSPEEAVRAFDRIADAMGNTARDRGLTEEKLRELLDSNGGNDE